MEENIGKVILDTRYYQGADLYSDGEIEDYMLQLAERYGDIEYSQVIAEEKSWPILYHFSHVRENIVNWLPITKEQNVLEVGSGCGAITGTLSDMAGQVQCIELSRKRSMINAYRHRDRENIHIILGNFQDIESDLTETYDWITLIGVFEYAEAYIGTKAPYVEMLKRMRKHLKPGGKLVIAIENRLGLKYWAGCREDHTGNYFEGLEDYPVPRGVRTFSRKEIEALIRKSGSWKTDFYYPYPDYKLPMMIYSDAYLPHTGELNQKNYNFDRDRMELFHESAVYDSLIRENQFPEFSNSFLIILEAEENE